MAFCIAPGCQTTVGCVCGMTGLKPLSPRWIADDPEKILYERVSDGVYVPAYRMTPLKS